MNLRALSEDLVLPMPGDEYKYELWERLGEAYSQLCDRTCNDPILMKEAQRRERIIMCSLSGRMPIGAIQFLYPLPPHEALNDVLNEVIIAIYDRHFGNVPVFDEPIQVYSGVLNHIVECSIRSGYIAEMQLWLILNSTKFQDRIK